MLMHGPTNTGRMGRRPCIALGSLLCVIGCVLASFASFGSTIVFFLGRFVTGFGVGVACFALPMYNSEVATPGIRGATGSLFQFNVVIGSFIATVITLFVHNWHVGMPASGRNLSACPGNHRRMSFTPPHPHSHPRTGIMLPAIPGVIIAFAIWLVPESPRFLMKAKGYDAGIAALRKVRSGDVTAEAKEIDETLQVTPVSVASRPRLVEQDGCH
jgi:MFS family permease